MTATQLGCLKLWEFSVIVLLPGLGWAISEAWHKSVCLDSTGKMKNIQYSNTINKMKNKERIYVKMNNSPHLRSEGARHVGGPQSSVQKFPVAGGMIENGWKTTWKLETRGVALEFPAFQQPRRCNLRMVYWLNCFMSWPNRTQMLEAHFYCCTLMCSEATVYAVNFWGIGSGSKVGRRKPGVFAGENASKTKCLIGRHVFKMGSVKNFATIIEL